MSAPVAFLLCIAALADRSFTLAFLLLLIAAFAAVTS